MYFYTMADCYTYNTHLIIGLAGFASCILFAHGRNLADIKEKRFNFPSKASLNEIIGQQM